MWFNVKSINCWDKCGESGGKCDACSVDGSPAYCCNNNLTSNEIALNGDCPLDAISSMAGESGYQSSNHTCVRSLHLGKNFFFGLK